MQDLLFLAHRIPYPPNKGDKIRSWHLLEFLARHYHVSLGCFIDDPSDRVHQPFLESLCVESYFAPLGPLTAKRRSVQGLLSGAPLTLAHYRDAGLDRWVRDVVARRRPGRVLVFSAAMAPYAMGAVGHDAKMVLDFVDVDSDKWRQYAATKPRWSSWFYRREARLLSEFERRAAKRFDASLFVSPIEANLFRSLAPDCGDDVFCLENGVDFKHFDPAVTSESPYPDGGPVAVFTGAMDYWPNVDAAVWFANEVFPRVRQAVPSARFYVVGANPTAAVRALAGHPGIHVSGKVDDVRPYLAFANVAVAPLRIARGIPNKVLEAMAMSRPVVATPQAVRGLRPGAEQVSRVERSVEGFAAATISLLGESRTCGRDAQARQWVVESYDWERSLRQLLALFEAGKTIESRRDTPEPALAR